MKLPRKNVVITGGSGGIGQALAVALMKEGCSVYSLDLQPPASQIPGVQHISTDVRSGDSIDRALQQIGNPIDLLINNAGVMRRGRILDATEEEFDLLLDVNVKGSWLMLKHALPRLSPSAVIVQMISRHALHPPENPALYAFSKIAIDRLLDFFERSEPAYDVRRLYPGPVDTPIARAGLSQEEIEEKEKILTSPQDLAPLIITLLKEDKKKLVYNHETGKHELL